MKRRDFVRRLPMATVGCIAGASTVLSGCAGIVYIVPELRPGRLSISASAFNAGEAFVQGPGMDRPIYLRRVESGEIHAVLASCTHRGCQPEPVGDRLVCPCHGSEFSWAGDVLAGPAERPLTRYVVEEEPGTVIVILGEGSDR